MRLMASLVLTIALAAPSGAQYSVSLAPEDAPIPATFFGMHIHRATNGTPWPSVPFGSWRLWDSKVTWQDVEPARNQWNFTLLDKEVDLALSRHVEPIVPLGISPTWASARPQEPSSHAPGGAAEPANMDDWRNYVRTLGKRYQGRVFQYEIWNEPNVRKFYSGSIPMLVDLTREAYIILHGIDPRILVISPSYPGFDGLPGFNDFLAQGGGNFVDVIGFHLYVNSQPPEKMAELALKVKDVMHHNGVNKPLWNTEAGWAHPKPFPPDLAPGWVSRAFIVTWAAGISRFYWYAWDNHDWVTLEMVDKDNRPKPAATAYATTEKWLVGATMKACFLTNSGVWICSLTRDGAESWVVWKQSGQGQFAIPSGWHVHQAESLFGAVDNIGSGQELSVGPVPQLLH
jgi:hypothetical protein